MTLSDIVNDIVEVIVHRAEHGLNFGTILIPEGLIEFIPAMRKLVSEWNDLWPIITIIMRWELTTKDASILKDPFS